MATKKTAARKEPEPKPAPPVKNQIKTLLVLIVKELQHPSQSESQLAKRVEEMKVELDKI